MWRVACVTSPVEYQMYKQKATIGYFILHSQVLSAALHCTVHARLEVTSLVWRSTDCGGDAEKDVEKSKGEGRGGRLFLESYLLDKRYQTTDLIRPGIWPWTWNDMIVPHAGQISIYCQYTRV